MKDNENKEFIEKKCSLDKAKAKYENIKIPDNLSSNINTAKVMAKTKNGRFEKNNILGVITKSITAAAVLFMIFIGGINVSPTFANVLSEVPIISEISEIFKFDKGLLKAVENDYIQKVDKWHDDKGIRFTVNNIIYDRKKIVVDYTLTNLRDYEYLGFISSGKSFNYKDGTELKAFIYWGESCGTTKSYEESGEKRGKIEIEGDIDFSKEGIQILFENMRIDNQNNTIEGEWKVDVDFNKEFHEVKPITIPVKAQYSTEDFNLNLDTLNIYPTVSNIGIAIEKRNNKKFVGFKNAALVDGKGNKFKYSTASFKTNDGSEREMHFESLFFENAKEIYFTADDIYAMEDKDSYVILDLEKGEVLENNGYHIEFKWDCYYERNKESNEMEKKENKDSFEIIVNDERIVNPESKEFINSITFSNDAYDENDKIYKLKGFGFSHGKIFIKLNEDKAIPKKLKLKINDVFMESGTPIKIKLK